MNILETIDRWQFNIRYHFGKWCDDRVRAKVARRRAERDRDRAKDFYQRGVLSFAIGCLLVPSQACGPTATEAMRQDVRAQRDACDAHAREALTATGREDALRTLDDAAQRCHDEAVAFCASHNLDCSEVIR